MSHIERPVKTPSAPRPLKSQSRSSLKANYMVIEELIQLIENVALALQSGISNTETMGSLVQNLRLHGPQLETISKDTLDRAFVVFRNASQDERLNIMTRLKLLELIELRAKSWEDNGSNTYYKTKQATNVELPHEQLPYQQHVDVANAQSAFLSTSPTFGVGGGGAAAAASAAAIAAVGTPQQQHLLLSPGEVIRNSGKFLRPTKIPGKTYCKDEVVIRNADSGKVMGIKGRRVHMIEELSETIISFQRVNPGAKERLVQITGPAEDKINYAKQLMEDTIRRNASPVRLEPAPAAGGGSCSSLASSNSDEAVVQPRTPSGSSIANRLSFNSAQNFMTATAAAQQISQQQQHHHQQLQQQQQQVVNMLNHNAAAAAAANAANAAAGKVLRANQQTLLHSYSTNDASVGEYKFTVPVGQHLIKITGDCCDLVRVAKLVLDDYFSSSEFLASVEAGAAFDGTSVISPIATPTTPLGPPQFMLGNPLHNANTPLADSGIGLNYLAGGAQGNNNNHDGDDEVFVDANGVASQNGLARSRRSHFSRKDSTPEAVNNNNKSTVANTTTRPKAETTERASVAKSNPTRITYEYEYLLYYSKSPHAWNFPADWDKICEKSPSIVRNKVKGGLPFSYNDNILTMSLAPSSPNVVNVHANSKMIANDTANKPFPSTTTAKQSVTNNHSNETITNVNTKPYLGEGKSSTTHEITNMNSTSLTTNSTTSGISRVAQKPLRKPLACRQNYISDSSDSLMLQNDTISCSTEYDMSLSSARYGSTCSLRSSLNGAAALDAQKLFNKQLKLISNAVEHNNDNDRQQLLQKQSKVKIQYEVASANIGNDEDVVIDLSNVDATIECHNNNCCSSQNYKNISDSEVDFKQKSTTHNHMQRTYFTCDCTPKKT